MKKLITKLLVVAMFFTILPANLVMAEENQEKQKQQVSSKVEEKVKKKEATDKRTEKSKTFYNNNGTATTEIHQSPIHYQDPTSKKWKDIDNTLVKKSTSDTYTNGGNVFQVSFTDTLTNEKSVMEMTEKGYSISLKPISSNDKVPESADAKVKENKVTYVEAFENTDLVYSVGNEKVKEDIILKEKPSTDDSISYTFAMDLKGLTHEVQEDGRILLKDKKSGDTIYYLEKPYMFDSFKPEGFTGFSESSVPEEALSYEVEMKTEKKGNQLLISIIPSKDWLLDDSRTYPVTIDPTIVKYQPVTELVDTNIRSALPTQTGGADLELGAGLYKNSTTNNVIRSLLNFDVSDIPAGVRVIDAQLNLWASSVWNDTSVRLDLHPVKSAWDENAATWNKRTTSASWTTSGGDYGFPHYSSQTVGALGSTLASNHYKWSVAPTDLEKTINSSSPNFGVLLKSGSETTAAYKKFYSGDNLDYAGYSPLLAITYVTNSRLGLENYWTYDEGSIADGQFYVNLGTGNGVLQFIDFEIDSRGSSGILFERTYNTKASESNSFGPGWSFTGSETITEQASDKNITYTDSDGTVHAFLYNSVTGSYQAPSGTYFNLVKSGVEEYILTDKYGNVSTFKKISHDSNTSGFTVAKIKSQQDTNGNLTSYTYNTKGQLTVITDASGSNLTISYGASGISSVVFGGKKVTYHYTYDGLLREVREYKDSTSYASTFFAYDVNEKLEKITDANNATTQIKYHDGFVQSFHQPSLLDTSVASTTYSYDILNYTSIVTDPEGGQTKYKMNDNYVILTTTDSLGNIFSNDKLDANYNAIQTTDAKGITNSRLFDSKGNLIEETDFKGLTTYYTYDSFSNMTSIKDLEGLIQMKYDSKGNLLNTIQPNGDTITYTYDAYGNRTSVTFADGTQEFYSYDDTNSFQNKTIDALKRETLTVTDIYGNVTKYTDAKGYSNSYTYNSLNLLTKVVNPENQITVYNYDNNENMTSIIDAKGSEKSYLYDSFNQLISTKQPMGEETLMTYDLNGNRISVSKPSGDLITSRYDANDQLVGLNIDGIENWKFVYDKNGNLESSTDLITNQMKTFKYDSYDNVSSMSEKGISIEYGYNSSHELTSLDGISNNITLNQTYLLDSFGRLEETQLNDQKVATFKYTSADKPSSVILNNGIQSVYSYDKAQQMTALNIEQGGLPFLNESFGHDLNGNIISLNSNAQTYNYTYDTLNQLKSQTLIDGTLESYEYDVVGNRTKKTTTKDGHTEIIESIYNSNNQLITMNGTNYTYDANGNRIKDADLLYEYNELDQLVATRKLTGELISTYAYDEQGRRSTKVTNGTATHFHYGKGSSVLFETNDVGDVVVEYSYDDSGYPITMKKNGEIFYYVLNGHKDVVALTNSLGQAVASYTYDAWGTVLTKNGPMADQNPYLYSGYRYDEDTELYYLMARYYKPQEGVFLSRDPFSGKKENPLTQNGYNYASNNPVMNNDPSGKWSMRKDYIAGAIDSLLAIIPSIGTFNTLLRAHGRTQKAYKMLNGDKIRPKVEVTITKYFTRIGIKTKIVGTVLSWINTAFWQLAGFSIGKGVAYGLGKIFKVEKRYVKKYGYWGKKVWVEYVVF